MSVITVHLEYGYRRIQHEIAECLGQRINAKHIRRVLAVHDLQRKRSIAKAPEYPARKAMNLAEARASRRRRDRPLCPAWSKDHPWIESFWGRFTMEDSKAFHACETMSQLPAVIADRVAYYNEHRRHSALNYRRPLEELLTSLTGERFALILN